MIDDSYSNQANKQDINEVEQTLRFRLLEIVLQWEGRLMTNHLCNAFNIGRQLASKDIKHYISEFSLDGLEYDRKLKGYKPTVNFKPTFSQGSVNEYLHLLHQDKAQTSTLSLMDLRYGHTEVLDVPSRHVDPAIVRGLKRHTFASGVQCVIDVTKH